MDDASHQKKTGLVAETIIAGPNFIIYTERFDYPCRMKKVGDIC